MFDFYISIDLKWRKEINLYKKYLLIDFHVSIDLKERK